MKLTKRSAGAIGAAVVAAIIVVALIATNPGMFSRTAVPGPTNEAGITTTTTSTTPVNNGQNIVAVGGGNLTMSINQFSPSSINIRRGESVTFDAPRGSTEIHNVIVDMSNGTAMSSLELPFILPSGFSPEALQLAPPNNFGEPIIQNISDGRKSIIALNKALFYPSVVNQNGNVSYLQEHELIQQMQQATQQGSFTPPLSANYTSQGTEKVVSSGLIFDIAVFGALQQEGGGAGGEAAVPVQSTANNSTNQEGESPPPEYPVLSNFTVTFEKAGTYPFFCAFHPGMGGVVNVTQ